MLIKKIFLSFLFIFIHTWGNVIDKNGNVLPEIVIIFKKFNPKLESNPSLKSLNDIGQKQFLRKGERLSQEAIKSYQELCANLSDEDKQQILDCFKAIGDIKTIYPISKYPDYILIQGSTIGNLRERLMFLASLIKENRIKLTAETKIVFLMGDRKLFTSEEKILLNPSPFKLKENWKAPEKLPTNETELAEFAWEQLDLPVELQNHKPIFIKAEKKPNAPRAQTEDCVKEFIEKFIENNPNVPKDSTFLIVSSNPFVYYQEAVTKLTFCRLSNKTKAFKFEGTGIEFDITKYDQITSIGLLLDNLARTLYNELQIQNLLQ